MRNVLVMVPDLMFGVKISEGVRAVGGTPIDVTPATLLDHIGDADLVVVDSGRRDGWEAAVRALKNDPRGVAVPVLAFGPHVDVGAQRAAIAAGCDRIVTRGKFAAELPALLQSTARTGLQHNSMDDAPPDQHKPVRAAKDAI